MWYWGILCDKKWVLKRGGFKSFKNKECDEFMDWCMGCFVVLGVFFWCV